LVSEEFQGVPGTARQFLSIFDKCTIQRVFNKDVLPFIGHRPIGEIRRADLLELLARVEARGALSVAERIRSWLNQLFRYALVILPNLEHNPATDLDVVAAPQPPVQHNPFLRMSELPKLLQRLRAYRGADAIWREAAAAHGCPYRGTAQSEFQRGISIFFH
jgi:integrase